LYASKQHYAGIKQFTNNPTNKFITGAFIVYRRPAERLEMKLPKTVHCICRTAGETWCGREMASQEWAFVDWSHADRATKRDYFQTPCSNCMESASNNDPLALIKKAIGQETLREKEAYLSS
jgi:hypothetical protein